MTTPTSSAVSIGNDREPGAFARKYYAKSVGVILEVELEDDQVQGVVQLVDCNFDPRCQNLPTP